MYQNCSRNILNEAQRESNNLKRFTLSLNCSSFLLRSSSLHPEFVVQAFCLHQLAVSAALHSLVEDVDFVSVLDGGQPVCDCYARSAFLRRVKSFLYDLQSFS